MCVRTVAGTGGSWSEDNTNFTNDDFHTALATSIANIGLSAPSNMCRYQIDVNILGLSTPGFVTANFTVTLHANYKVYDAAGKPVLLETVSASHTATMSDSLGGSERQNIAVEGSIRESILQFLEKLRSASGT